MSKIALFIKYKIDAQTIAADRARWGKVCSSIDDWDVPGVVSSRVVQQLN